MMKIWPFTRKGASGFSAASTSQQVTLGIDAHALTAIVTGYLHLSHSPRHRSIKWYWGGNDTDSCYAWGSCCYGGEECKSWHNCQRQNEIPATKIDVMELDLSSLASVEKFASEYKSLGLPPNVLINNAGIMTTPYQLSKDNIELQFATNHLGHFHLTNLLLDAMKKTVLEGKSEGRIIIVSSEARRFAYHEGIRFDKLNDESGYSSLQAYGQSKLANILHANELTRRLKEEDIHITANSLHPGSISTNLPRHRSIINGLIHCW